MFIHTTAKKAAHRVGVLVSGFVLLIVVITITYGNTLEQQGLAIRRWNWNNLLLVLPLVPLLFLQQRATLPPLETIHSKRGGWRSTFLVGIVFGVLDVVAIKLIQHPEPYTSLPPFLQPFPYSIFLYTAGALEVELFYRMLPLTLALLLNEWLFRRRFRKGILVVLCLLTSVAEPVLQFPEGTAWWFMLYATASGMAMNAWQFRRYLAYGFGGSLAVRLGHYLVWHILLGIYVQFVELG